MKKKCLVLVLIIVLLFSFQVVSAEVDYTKEADMLNALGLFNGTQNGYELNRVPTRVEAAAMLVRLLGGMNEANEMKYEHPFTDVPEWANNIVGYMYKKGYTSGIGNNLFGSNQVTIARDYATFMLRSLGYSSSSDFNYTEALEFAVSNSIISNEEAEIFKSQEFKRNEMVLLSYRTLNTKLKDDSMNLIGKLYNEGSINKNEAYNLGLTDHYETVITNIDSSLDALNLTSSLANISVTKKDIKSGSIVGFETEYETFYTEGYGGGVSFKKGFNAWQGKDVKYEITFFSNGEFVKKMDYLVVKYNYENNSGFEFITPYDKFDEIKIEAYPYSSDDLINDTEGLYEIINERDSKILKNNILKYGGVTATSYDDYNINSSEHVKYSIWEVVYGGVTYYNNGARFRPYSNKMLVDRDFNLIFVDKGSGIGTEDSKPMVELPKSTDIINIIIIYEKDSYIPAKLYIVE